MRDNVALAPIGVTVLSALLYGYLYIAADQFASAFHVLPDELGISYTTMIVPAMVGGLIAIAAGAVLAVVIDRLHLLDIEADKHLGRQLVASAAVFVIDGDLAVIAFRWHNPAAGLPVAFWSLSVAAGLTLALWTNTRLLRERTSRIVAELSQAEALHEALGAKIADVAAGHERLGITDSVAARRIGRALRSLQKQQAENARSLQTSASEIAEYPRQVRRADATRRAVAVAALAVGLVVPAVSATGVGVMTATRVVRGDSVHETVLGLPVPGLQAVKVYVEPSSNESVPADIRNGVCALLLGSAHSTTVLYEASTHTLFRLPSSSITTSDVCPSKGTATELRELERTLASLSGQPLDLNAVAAELQRLTPEQRAALAAAISAANVDLKSPAGLRALSIAVRPYLPAFSDALNRQAEELDIETQVRNRTSS